MKLKENGIYQGQRGEGNEEMLVKRVQSYSYVGWIAQDTHNMMILVNNTVLNTGNLLR